MHSWKKFNIPLISKISSGIIKIPWTTLLWSKIMQIFLTRLPLPSMVLCGLFMETRCWYINFETWKEAYLDEFIKTPFDLANFKVSRMMSSIVYNILPLCIPPHEKQVYVFVDINEDVQSGSKNTTLLLVAASRFVFLHVPYLVSIVSIIFVARHLEIWHWTFSSPLSSSSFFDDYKQFQNGISWIWYTLPLE